MRKINSIWYGSTLLGAGLAFSAGIPLLLSGISKLFGFFPKALPVIEVSAGAGAAILLFLAGLLAVELRQDKRLNRFYLKTRNRKTEISAGSYECQSCGSRNVRKEDKACPVCGIVFFDT